jgi:alkanesulfonate monooxygenase SsuD/methylene tetrahydromethanopterin reductase-like flavin-dependent oxidoreductase (luciferase family)
VYPFLGETSEEAKAKYQRMVTSNSFIEAALASVGQITDIDFSKFSLDEPLPRITTNGEQSSLDKFRPVGHASERFDSGLDLIGTPEEVADRMGPGLGRDRRRRLSGQHAVSAG